MFGLRSRGMAAQAALVELAPAKMVVKQLVPQAVAVAATPELAPQVVAAAQVH
jgi:hypothetical protein